MYIYNMHKDEVNVCGASFFLLKKFLEETQISLNAMISSKSFLICSCFKLPRRLLNLWDLGYPIKVIRESPSRYLKNMHLVKKYHTRECTSFHKIQLTVPFDSIQI